MAFVASEGTVQVTTPALLLTVPCDGELLT